MSRRVVVIGAGPSGLATAIGLGGAASCTVLERRGDVGGLSGSVEIEGAVFDVGGHSFSTPHADVRALVFDTLPMFEQRRDARCSVAGQVIDYPFQRHFAELRDERIVRACAAGLAAADGGGDAANFADYVRRRFGAGIAAHFMLPYNRKLWARDLRRLATDWVRERVATPRVSRGDAARAADSSRWTPPTDDLPRRTPLAEDTVVAYPARGGFGEIARALARRVPDVRLAAAVTRIDVARRVLATADGTIHGFARLVSTIAPGDLLAMIDGVPPSLREATAGLESVALRVVLAVAGHRLETPMQRLYVADPRYLPHKIALNHNSSDFLRRRPRSAIIAEVSFSDEKPLPEGDVERRVVRDLVALGIVRDERDVVRTASIDVRHAYPVPTHDRAARMRAIRAWLDAHGVHTVGRLGEWDYVNSDECLRRGLALGRALAADLCGVAAEASA